MPEAGFKPMVSASKQSRPMPQTTQPPGLLMLLMTKFKHKYSDMPYNKRWNATAQNNGNQTYVLLMTKFIPLPASYMITVCMLIF
jgi:hypothetical protein